MGVLHGIFVSADMKSAIPFFLLILFASCRPDKEKERIIQPGNSQLELHLGARVGSETFETGTVYWSPTNYRFRLENFQMYVSMIELVRSDGSSVRIREFDLINLNGGAVFSVSVPPGDYTLLRFNQGIPPEYNKNVDPTTYPNSHPLSVQGSNGMFWTWNSGYIFTRFDGKADLDGIEGNPLLHPFAFHAGDDPLFRTIELSLVNPSFPSDGSRTLSVFIQVEHILNNPSDPIDISVDNLTHTGGNFILARRFTDNLADSYILVE